MNAQCTNVKYICTCNVENILIQPIVSLYRKIYVREISLCEDIVKNNSAKLRNVILYIGYRLISQETY